MSTAWYKPTAVPKLLRSFTRTQQTKDMVSSVQVWNTTCIVTNFGKSKEPGYTTHLINPSNPTLLGVRNFPYFPKGGPVPEKLPEKDEHHIMGYVTKWGGVDLKEGMLFPFNTVDGLVHQYGGWKLALHCYMLPRINSNGDKCPVGKSVMTPSGGQELQREYDAIAHTVPPFYDYHSTDPNVALAGCYRDALRVCEENVDRSDSDCINQKTLRIACPLLGAGGRGFPIENAIVVAAEESVRWLDKVECEDNRSTILAFGIPYLSVAEKLIRAISSRFRNEENELP